MKHCALTIFVVVICVGGIEAIHGANFLRTFRAEHRESAYALTREDLYFRKKRRLEQRIQGHRLDETKHTGSMLREETLHELFREFTNSASQEAEKAHHRRRGIFKGNAMIRGSILGKLRSTTRAGTASNALGSTEHQIRSRVDSVIGACADRSALHEAGNEEYIPPAREDFYSYVNSPFPYTLEESMSQWGSWEELQEVVTLRTLSIVSSARASNDDIIQPIFENCMDFSNRTNIEPLETLLDIINDTGIPIERVVAELHFHGVFAGFAFSVNPDMSNSSKNMMSILPVGNPARTRDEIDAYRKMLTALKDQNWNGTKTPILPPSYFRGDAVETTVAYEEKLRSSMADLSKLRSAEFTNNMRPVTSISNGTFAWSKYFGYLESLAGIAPIQMVNIDDVKYIDWFSNQVESVFDGEFREYAKMLVLVQAAAHGPGEHKDDLFEYKSAITGVQGRKEQMLICVDTLNGMAGERVGQKYVETYFDDDRADEAISFVKNVAHALEEVINGSGVLDEHTRKEAIRKFRLLSYHVARPKKWVDFSTLDLVNAQNMLDIAFRIAKFWTKKELSIIHEAKDPDKWHMNAHEVNAYYDSSSNVIAFPAAVFAEPLYIRDGAEGLSKEHILAWNYGALGAIIGHEVGHGYDDNGRLFDGLGNLRDWWTEEDVERYDSTKNRVIELYSRECCIADNLCVDGALTVGENLADIVGVRVALKALKRVCPKCDSKVFFSSWAFAWRTYITDKAAALAIKTDVHSPAKCRVNVVLRNNPCFHEAFRLIEGDEMSNKTDLIAVWSDNEAISCP